MLETLIGTLPEPAFRQDFGGVQREDGSWLMDGGLTILEAEEMLGINSLLVEGEPIKTLAGFVLAQSNRIPKAGDHFVWKNWRFEVVDMDRNRVDKVLVSPPPKTGIA